MNTPSRPIRLTKRARSDRPTRWLTQRVTLSTRKDQSRRRSRSRSSCRFPCRRHRQRNGGNGDSAGEDVRVGTGGYGKTKPSRHDSRRGLSRRSHRAFGARPYRLAQSLCAGAPGQRKYRSTLPTSRLPSLMSRRCLGSSGCSRSCSASAVL
jgi:hypothetical protein